MQVDALSTPDPAGFDRMLRLTTEEATIIVQSAILPLVPVRTGRLRGSIYYQAMGHRGIVGTSVEYAIPVEYRKPYMRLGFGLAKPKVLQLYEDRIGQFLAGSH
jgi:hypothetical protein